MWCSSDAASSRPVLNAMKAGIAAGGGTYVLITMSDGSDEPHIVDSMVAYARDEADVVAASRYMRGGRQVGGPVFKRLMSRTAGLTLHLVRRRTDPRLHEQLQSLHAPLS